LLLEGVILNITRKKAASSANQSSDLRQKMRKPTAHQIAVMIAREMVSRAAYPLTEKPLVESAWSTFAVSAPGRLHNRGPTHALWSC